MSKKSPKIAALVERFQGNALDAHYLCYFELFNTQLYYEAHDVLEELWLKDRQSPNYSFYKGLIQLAGAFVHLQKNRLRPSASLFKLAQANLGKYPELHESFSIAAGLELIQKWLGLLEKGKFEVNPFHDGAFPKLGLNLAGAPIAGSAG